MTDPSTGSVPVITLTFPEGDTGAVRDFFYARQLPESIAYLVLHTARQPASALASIIQQALGWTVHPAAAGMKVQAGRVYLCPVPRQLALKEGVFKTITEKPLLLNEGLPGDLEILWEDDANGAKMPLREVLRNTLRLAGLVVDTRFNIRQTTGDIRRFVAFPEKGIDLNLLALVPEELARTMNNLFYQANETGQPQREDQIRITEGSRVRLINAAVSPTADGDRYFVLLQETGTVAAKSDVAPAETSQGSLVQYRQIQALQAELEEARQALEVSKSLNLLTNDTFYISNFPMLVLQSTRDDAGKIQDFRLQAANDAAGALFGYSAVELVGKHFRDIHPLDSLETVFEQLRNTAQTGTPSQMEYPLQGTGAPHWYSLVVVQNRHGVTLTYTDITEVRQAADRLRTNYAQLVAARRELRELNSRLETTVEQRTHELAKSEERLRLVASATNDAIYDWEIYSGLKWWSEGIENQFGHPIANSIQNPDFWQQNLHPDDREKVLAALQESINEHSEWHQEYRFRRAEGSYAYVLDRASIIRDANGIPYRMLGSMLDITPVHEARLEAERRQAEYYDLANSMPNIVWTAGTNGDIEYFNHHWEAYTGYQLSRPVPLEALEAYFHPDDFSVLCRNWEQARQERKPLVWEARLRHTKDGSYRWFKIVADLKRSGDPENARWHGVFLDIHESKTSAYVLEQRVAERTSELYQVNAALQRSNADLLQFAFVSSHDLKEPLRKIQIFGKMLQQRASQLQEPAFIEPVARIVYSAERMTSLIDDLLSYSRLSAPRAEEPTNLNAIIESIESDLEVAIAEKEALIEVDTLPVIEAVPGQMRQLFQNFISNGLKFSRPEVPPHIRISGYRIAEKSFESPAQESGSYLRISISDNGIGFDEKYVDKIFTLFQRLHTRQEYEGTGIGLAIVKKIVDQHQGLLQVQSRVDEGTTFELILPLKATRIIP